MSMPFTPGPGGPQAVRQQPRLRPGCGFAGVAALWLALLLPPPVLAEEPLALDALLRAVADRNPELRSRNAEVRAAQQRPAQARAFEDPMLMAELWQVPTSLDRAPLMFTLRQPIPWPGKLRARAAVLEPAALRAAAEARSTGRTLRLEAVRAYYDYRLAIRSLDVLRQNRQLLSTVAESIQVRYRVGRADLAELLKARAELASLDNQLLDLERQRDLAITAINTLLDRAADAPLGEPITAPVIRAPPSLASLTEQALGQRPEVQAVAAALGQARAQVQAARAERAPDLAAWAGFMAMLPHGADNTFTVGLQTSIPSFSLQRSNAMAREAFAMGEAQQAALGQTRARVRGEVREALLRLETAERQIRLRRETLLPLAEQTVSAAQASYQSGRVDLVLLLDAARGLFDQRLEHERSLADYGQRLGELEAALGGQLNAGTPERRGGG